MIDINVTLNCDGPNCENHTAGTLPLHQLVRHGTRRLEEPDGFITISDRRSISEWRAGVFCSPECAHRWLDQKEKA